MPDATRPTADRRALLLAMGGAAIALPFGARAQTADNIAAPMGPMPPLGHGNDPAGPDTAGFVFFNLAEAPLVESIVDVLIPEDDLGPGGVALGVATYIDRQLAGAYGRGARLYLQGPFETGTPQQGYQLALTPAELIRLGLADLDRWVMAAHGKDFLTLDLAARVDALKEIERGEAKFDDVPSAIFFDHLLNLSMEGYFGDPIYGGNRGKASWTMLGFPGVGGMYATAVSEYRNRPFAAGAKSIQDWL